MAIKSQQQETWGRGDYSVIGSTVQIVGEALCEALDVRSGQRVLDVAAGNGNASLAAARRYCEVTSTDYVPKWLECGRRRAQADGLSIRFQVADAEDLPFADQCFDAVVSTFGVMFAPNHARAAEEMARVCRAGGQIGLANWTPDSFIGALLKIVGRHAPAPSGVQSPVLWGTESHLTALFEGTLSSIECARRTYTFRYRDPRHWLETWRAVYGPLRKAFESLDIPAGERMAHDLLQLANRLNRAQDGTLVVDSAYLEAVIGLR